MSIYHHGTEFAIHYGELWWRPDGPYSWEQFDWDCVTDDPNYELIIKSIHRRLLEENA